MPLTAPFALVALVALALVGYAQLKLLTIARQAMAPQGPRVGAALLAVAGVGATGLVSLGVAGAAGLAAVGTTLVENGPVRRVTIERSSDLVAQSYDPRGQTSALGSSLIERAERSLTIPDHDQDLNPHTAPYALQLGIDWAGDVSPAHVRKWLSKELDLDAELIRATPVLEAGQTLTRLQFGIRLSRGERNDLRDLQLALDLPARVTIEIDRP